jgi:hypothetical protein
MMCICVGYHIWICVNWKKWKTSLSWVMTKSHNKLVMPWAFVIAHDKELSCGSGGRGFAMSLGSASRQSQSVCREPWICLMATRLALRSDEREAHGKLLYLHHRYTTVSCGTYLLSANTCVAAHCKQVIYSKPICVSTLLRVIHGKPCLPTVNRSLLSAKPAIPVVAYYIPPHASRADYN